MSDPKAQVAKEKGNAAFKAGDYPLAIGHYTAALMADARDPTYPLNRAAAYLKLGKNEDAERDCTTVLRLSSGNVKALFRRGQARVGMGRLTDAQNDFSAVLRVEPANVSAQDEVKKLTTRIQEEKAKKVKTKTPITPVPLTTPSADSATAPRRRRVPIKIIDPSSPVASSSATETAAGPSMASGTSVASSATATRSVSVPAAAPTLKSTSTPNLGTLEAVSSRSLKPAATTAATPETPIRAPIPPALASVAATLQSPPEAVQETDRDNAKGKARAVPAETFAQAKQARASAKPSRVGGGIFRSSGESTIFAPRGAGTTGTTSVVEEVPPVPVSASPHSSPPPSPTPDQAATVPAKVNFAAVTAPTTLFDLNRMWNAHKTPEERWALLTTVTPAQLPGLCQTALEPALLASMLSVFRAKLATCGGDDNVRGGVRAYVEALSRIPRFGTLVLFLSRAEKEDARSVFTALEATPTGVWQAVR
ncbi:hypothetical protein HYPSUDRAFT_65593 [Hypholoma sublateritium FD-334 SS-4]|uniref:RNA polymerase II-associated protein 3 n=1 Tax=Hypholoma sublateritium (strain FD-334 SS-4) TaxID=945553 RepID=A0A0D2PY88_HYPSF|nr:hypothetical protein HYPSUDRAFT_65593 [Hypholoma sublateritium FD-334 SS-4]